jgi:hypothetical protein
VQGLVWVIAGAGKEEVVCLLVLVAREAVRWTCEACAVRFLMCAVGFGSGWIFARVMKATARLVLEILVFGACSFW